MGLISDFEWTTLCEGDHSERRDQSGDTRGDGPGGWETGRAAAERPRGRTLRAAAASLEKQALELQAGQGPPDFASKEALMGQLGQLLQASGLGQDEKLGQAWQNLHNPLKAGHEG